MFLFAWTPLISTDMFDGIKADLTGAGSGILTAAVIIIGIAFLLSALRR
jgi:hypothetical protein